MTAYIRRNSIAFRATAGLLVGCYLPACTGWHTQSAAPEQVMTTKHPAQVRITRQDGSRVVLLQPVIEGDSVTGRDAGASGGPDSLKPRIAVALAEVRTVELQQTDAAKTVLLVGAAGLLIVVIIAAASEPFTFKGNGQNSCPVAYAWDGHDWQLQSGTFAGAVARGVARSEVTAISPAPATNGALRLQVRNELDETDYLDAISLLAVDHPPGVSVAPDAGGRPHAVGTLVHAREAQDFAGRDVASQLAAPDGRSWESSVQSRDTAAPGALVDGIELVFPRPPEARMAQLAVDARNTSWVPFMLERTLAAHGRATRAWYDSLLASPTAAREYRDAVVREAGLRVLVRRGAAWVPQGVVLDPGPEVTKRQVVAVDLTGIEGPVVQVRLESAPSFWLIDHVAMSYDAEPAITVQEVTPVAARTPQGAAVLSLVATADGQAWAFEKGQQAEVAFPVPAVAPGMARSYLVRATGWYTIHVPDMGDADVAALQRIIREPGAVAKLSVTTFNEALRVAGAPQRGAGR
jgi:hypothetical protein